ncbi:stage VI sporulation protein D [Metabacillus crassostreae]|uniref:stage VI sporulation protein D n=1 Tax=Metabacillus crassostreae TaxID=929098 RepID=UPI001958AA87|nr:stage VI sporulation protein D [Metabacillus crassostreae]MBM7605736.1 stage VI sporulation protein D [Metabacillus crassostreae]
MSQEQQLRFSVEESVWFQKGQEVSELLSISLDPDITIHEHDQYISIRGALQLTGEYKIDNDASAKEQFEYANVRYVNEVSTREDGVSVLNHRFPVDITIPRNRIEQLEEVYVSIESFDYELPEYKCLKLIADLSISGISDGQVEQVSTEVERPEEKEEAFEALFRGQQQQPNAAVETPTPTPPQVNEEENVSPFSSFYEDSTSEQDLDKFSSFQLEETEVKEDRVLEESHSEVEQLTSPKDVNNSEVEETILTNEIEQQEEEVIVSEEQEEQKEEDPQEDLYDPFVVEVRKEAQEVEDEPKEVQYSFFSKTEEASLESETEEDDVDGRDETNPKDAHYLTSLFARDEEEDFSRVKMCIVQQGDSIELISQRYDISVQQILRVNDFHADQDVYEGQILYIPSYSTSK